MRNYLIGKNLWGFITGTELKPFKHATIPTEEQIRNFNYWNEKDKMVMFVLIITKYIKLYDWAYSRSTVIKGSMG